MARRGGLKRLAAGLERELTPVVFAAAQRVEVAAVQSIMEGSASGKGHVPSRPGEPPNNQDGDLVRGIKTIQPEPLVAVVTSNAPHSIPLEWGTSKMGARPFMRPAAVTTSREVGAMIAKGVTGAVRKLGAG